MRAYSIVWRPKARADLFALYDWIANEAGADTAYNYTSQIEEQVAKLAYYPDRGTPRDDLVAGLRTIAYRRRTTIAYRVFETEVEILSIIHAGKELTGLFHDD